jgi:hypothetical protein
LFTLLPFFPSFFFHFFFFFFFFFLPFSCCQAAALYAGMNASLAATVLPHVPNASVAAVLAASVDAGACLSEVIAAGWAVMLWGYAGDRAGGAYNVSAIRAGLDRYDAAWAAYGSLSARHGAAAAPGCFNASFWQHPQSGVPGMQQSVDRYRHLRMGN